MNAGSGTVKAALTREVSAAPAGVQRAAEISIKSGTRSRPAPRARLGQDRACSTRAVKRELRDIGSAGRRRIAAAPAGRSCSRRSDRVAVTASRSTCPDTATAVARTHQAADDRHLGAASGREQRREARVRRGAAGPARRWRSRSSVREVAAGAREIALRGLGAALGRQSGSDCNSRCTSRPRASALRPSLPARTGGLPTVSSRPRTGTAIAARRGSARRVADAASPAATRSSPCRCRTVRWARLVATRALR